MIVVRCAYALHTAHDAALGARLLCAAMRCIRRVRCAYALHTAREAALGARLFCLCFTETAVNIMRLSGI